jgi:hypothetical protein
MLGANRLVSGERGAEVAAGGQVFREHVTVLDRHDRALGDVPQRRVRRVAKQGDPAVDDHVGLADIVFADTVFADLLDRDRAPVGDVGGVDRLVAYELGTGHNPAFHSQIRRLV